MKKKIVFIILGIILAGVTYGVYSFYQINNPEMLFTDSSKENEKTVNKISNDEDKSQDSNVEPVLSKESESDIEEEVYKFDSNKVNILLLGIDASEGRYETMKSFRTDTIMLLSADFQEKMVQIISIPRDSYVEIPGQEEREKINAAFVRGGGFEGEGFEKVMETVSNFLGGVPVDYYVGVDMDVVKEIIDIMGGLDYEVDVEVNIAGRTLQKGFQHLNGQQVLDYARTRHTGKGDIDRIERQQKIVMAVFNQLKSTDQITKIPQFYNAVMEKVYTNMNLKQIAALAFWGAKLETDNIHTYTMPGGFVNLGGISYWGIDEYGKKELVSEIFGIDIEVDPEQDIKYLKERMEEEQEIWMKAVNEGQATVNAGRRTLKAYGEAMLDDEKTIIENLINSILNCIDERDMEGIYNNSEELHKQNDIIVPVAAQRYNAIKSAKQVLNDVLDKAQVYQAFLLEDEKSKLQEMEDKVWQGISAKEVQTIEQAVADLKNYADNVFNSCKERQKLEESQAQSSEQKSPESEEDSKQEEQTEEKESSKQ